MPKLLFAISLAIVLSAQAPESPADAWRLLTLSTVPAPHAAPVLAASLQSHRLVGTSPGITTQFFGEDSSGAALTSIAWQFNGVTQASLTPTEFTAPGLRLHGLAGGGKQVLCLDNNGLVYAGNNSGSGPPCP
jgi:hypothetical protein